MSNPFIPENYNNRTMNPFSPNYNKNLANLYYSSKKNRTNSVNSFKTASLGSPMRASVGTQKKTKTPKRRGVSVVPRTDLKSEARSSKKIIVIVPKNAQGIKLVKV